MSDKDRKKKDGHDKNKELQAMHEAERGRHEDHPHKEDSHDEADLVKYKSGSSGDRTQVGAG
jgi:hypothetical protein